MAQSPDERITGDFVFAPGHRDLDERPALSHEVIAAYAADAARSVPGVVGLHAPLWKELSALMRDSRGGGVVVKDSRPGAVDLDIHVKVAWGVVIPDLAVAVEEAVRQRVTGLLDIELDTVTLYVDEITGPGEVSDSKEG
jgi:uncharacterized alkaline shock family protein YloU